MPSVAEGVEEEEEEEEDEEEGQTGRHESSSHGEDEAWVRHGPSNVESDHTEEAHMSAHEIFEVRALYHLPTFRRLSTPTLALGFAC